MLLLSIIQAEKSFSICHANISKLIVNYWNMHKNTFLFRSVRIFNLCDLQWDAIILYKLLCSTRHVLSDWIQFSIYLLHKRRGEWFIAFKYQRETQTEPSRGEKAFSKYRTALYGYERVKCNEKGLMYKYSAICFFFMQDHWRIQHHLWVPDVCCLCMDHFRYEIK